MGDCPYCGGFLWPAEGEEENYFDCTSCGNTYYSDRDGKLRIMMEGEG